MSAASSAVSERICTICQDGFSSQPTLPEEEEQILDCSHSFHRECIGEWFKRIHNCPLCRAHVNVGTPEAPRPEMTAEEVLAVPDTEILSSVRTAIQTIRRVRRLALNENTPVSRTAAKVNSVAARFFNFR